MRLTSEHFGTERGAEATKPAGQPRCPVCSGPLVELRSNLRCSRCYFTICEGCACDPGDNFACEED